MRLLAVGALMCAVVLGQGNTGFQVNGPGADLSIDGATSSSGEPLMDLQWVREDSIVTTASIHVGMPWDLGFTTGACVAGGGGGIPTPNGQVFNLSLADPTFVWLNNGTFVTPFASQTVPFNSPVPTTFTMQMGVLSPTHPDGVEISAPNIMAVDRVCAQEVVAEGVDLATLSTQPVVVYETQAQSPVVPGVEESMANQGSMTTGTMTLSSGGTPIASQAISIDNATRTVMVGGLPAQTVGDVFGPLPIPIGMTTGEVSFSLSAPVTIDIPTSVIIRVILALKTWVTDKGKVVKTFCDGRPGSPDMTQQQVDDWLNNNGFGGGAVTQVCPASDSYDCHGYTFACGLKWINDDQVQKILDDNCYKAVAAGGVMVGDIVVYCRNGKITHTGKVTAVDANGNATEITSKWGRLPKFKHPPMTVPGSYGTPKYRRSKRMGDKLKCKLTP